MLGSACPGSMQSVALRKESVDRNVRNAQGIGVITVALRKESVDRNFPWAWMGGLNFESLSARRAWIEIGGYGCAYLYLIGRSPQGERG